jgi:transposase
MTEIQPAPRQPSSKETDRLTCPKCQAPMELAVPVPGLRHLAHRIFECGKCQHIQIAPE